MVGLDGFEPSTSRLSGGRSNQLSYRPSLLNRHAIDGRNSIGPGDGSDTSLGLQKLNSVWRRMGRQSIDFPIERVTGRTRDSNQCAFDLREIERVTVSDLDSWKTIKDCPRSLERR